MSEQIISKSCSKCKQIKSLTEFYKKHDNKDGHRNECKTCWLKYTQSEKGKATHKRHRQSEKYKVYQKRLKARHPERVKAHSAVNNTIAIGKLPRANTKLCHCCPKPAQQYQHYKGYKPEHWLDVVPVCIKCHVFSSK